MFPGLQAFLGWLVLMGLVVGGVLLTFVALGTGALATRRDESCVMCSREMYTLLQDVPYPAGRNDILAWAKSAGAKENHLADLLRLSARATYRSIDDVCCNANQVRQQSEVGT